MEEEKATSSSNTREIQAMTLNLKEQRILLKRLQIMQLEQSFRLKSLNLDKKQIKLLQKRLCSNVGKIKSYLSAEDIAFMKNLELEGRFKPEYNSVDVSHFMTIMAAEKRLKLLSNDEILQLTEDDFKEEPHKILVDTPRDNDPDTADQDDPENPPVPDDAASRQKLQLGRSKSASQRLSSSRTRTSATPTTEDISRLHVRKSSAKTTVSYRDNRSTSLPPEAIRSSSNPRRSSRPASRNNTLSANLPILPSKSHLKAGEDSVDGSAPISRASSHSSGLDEAATLLRPSSTISRLSRARSKMEMAKPQTAREGKPPAPRPMTTGGFLTARRPSAANQSRPRTTLSLESKSLNYSSHKTVSLQQPGQGSANRGRRISVMSSSSLGNEMAKEKATEQRRELLVNEQSRSDGIEEKRQVFLSRMSKWVEENPSIVIHQKPKYAFIDSSDVEKFKNNANTKTMENEGLYRRDNEDAWKDLKKCRYLRMKDDKIDLSGINTLAKDQMHMFGGFRIDYSAPRRVADQAVV